MSRAQDLGAMLRKRRLGKGLTQRELAKRCGLKTARIAHVETGADVPTARIVRAVAKATGANARETIDLLRLLTIARRRRVIAADDLTADQIGALIAIVETERRANTPDAACMNCNAGPGQDCAKRCEPRRKGGKR